MAPGLNIGARSLPGNLLPVAVAGVLSPDEYGLAWTVRIGSLNMMSLLSHVTRQLQFYFGMS
eukprot:scaffold306425_cov17-Prasinocladus_malaysianus.AAC.1